jgi:hypothetical protein
MGKDAEDGNRARQSLLFASEQFTDKRSRHRVDNPQTTRSYWGVRRSNRQRSPQEQPPESMRQVGTTGYGENHQPKRLLPKETRIQQWNSSATDIG